MSEGSFLAEASVLIRPDTTKFAALLEAELTAIVATAKIPPVVIPVATTAGASTGAGKVAITEQTAALSTQTEALAANTAGAVENADAQRALGATTGREIDARKAAAGAASLQAKAEAEVAAAQRANTLAAQGVITQQDRAAIATRAAATADANLRTALLTEDEALIATAAATANLAREQAVLAGKATAAARSQTQFARGGGASILTLLGIRGATLAASAPFLIGTAAIVGFAKSLSAASREAEAFARVQKVLGGAVGKELQDRAGGLATSFGLSATAALKAEGAFAELFHNVGLNNKQAADLSERMVKLAADVAAFNNVPVDQALLALQRGLQGNVRGLRALVPGLATARINQLALADSGKKTVTSLTQQELVLARLSEIQRLSANQTGTFAARSGDLAGQAKILSANLENIGATLGQVLAQAVLPFVSGLNILIQSVEDTSSQIKKFVTDIEKSSPVKLVIEVIQKFPGGEKTAHSFFSHWKADLEIGLGAAAFTAGGATSEVGIGIPVAAAGAVLLAKGLKDEQNSADAAKRATDGLQNSTALMLGTAKLAALALNSESTAALIGAAAFKTLTAEQQANDVALLKINATRAAGATHAQNIAAAQRTIAIQQGIIASTESPSRRQAALRLQAQARATIRSEQAAIASDAASAAAAIKSAADKAAAAQATATQTAIDRLSARQQNLQNRLTRSQLFGTVLQQIAITKQIVAADLAEIKALKDRITHLHLHGQALKLAQAAIAAALQEIFNARNSIQELQKQRKQNLLDAKQAAADAQQTHLEAVLSIAETTASTSDDRKATEALIKFDEEQIARLKRIRKRTREQNAQLDAYLVDLAQRNEALKKIAGTQKQGRTFAQDAFAFLQTQQGFVSNLLGNLIPGSATGLVGGSAGPRQAIASIPNRLGLGRQNQGGGFEEPRGVKSTSAFAAASFSKPPSAGQANVQIDLLRKILAGIHQLGKTSEHPEAKKQRHTGSSAMDFHIQGTYGM